MTGSARTVARTGFARPVCAGVIIVGVVLAGCGSLHRDAQILMEGGAYGDAAKVYAQILQEDPKDARAIVGLQQARTKWIDTKLIDVRMLRLAEQSGPATDLLRDIIEREREWKFYPEGAVQYTQEEETRFAERFIASQVEAWQGKGFLLQGRAFLARYQPLYATPTRVKTYETLRGRLASEAATQCRRERQGLSPDHPHWAAFLKRYCESWGVSFDPGFDLPRERAQSLYQVLAVAGQADSIPQALQARGQQRLTETFHQSPWYDPLAPKVLPVIVNAGFARDHTKTIEHTVHSYSVQVPYTVMVPMLRSVPHTTYQRSCNNYGCVTIPYTTYSYETYTVPVTKYRDEPRQQPYDRWRHRQVLVFHAELYARVGGTEAQAVVTEKSEETDTEHPHSMPNIGLQPDPLTLPDPLRWLERNIDRTADRWGQALSDSWIRLHCAEPSAAVTGPALAEHVFRCLRGNPASPPAFVRTWFKERFDAARDDVEQWLVHQGQAPPAMVILVEEDRGPAREPAPPARSPEPRGADAIRSCLDRAEAQVSKPADYVTRCLNLK